MYSSHTTTVQHLSQKVYDRLHQTKDGKVPVFIDPATLMLIMTIVSGVIKMLQECKKNKEEALEVSYNPSKREKKVLKRHIRRKLGWRKYITEGDYYYNALLDEGQFITQKDMDNAYRESEGDNKV